MPAPHATDALLKEITQLETENARGSPSVADTAYFSGAGTGANRNSQYAGGAGSTGGTELLSG